MPFIEANPDVVSSDLLEGGILFNLSTKQYYALNGTGLIVWKIVESGCDPDAVEAALLGRYQPGTSADPLGVRGFIEALSTEGLIVPATVRQAGAEVLMPFPDQMPESWAFPELRPHGDPLSKVILSPFDPTVPIPE